MRQFPTLLTSHHAAANTNHNGITSYTAAGSQGLTFDSTVNVVLDRSWGRCSEQVSLVACTRSRSHVHFVLAENSHPTAHGLHPAFDALLTGRPIDYVSTHRHLLGSATILRRPSKIRALGEPRLRLHGAGPWDSLTKRFHRQTGFIFDPYHPRRIRDPTAPPITVAHQEDVVLDWRTNDPVPQVIPSLDTNHLPETRRPLHLDINCAVPEPVSITETTPVAAPSEPVYPGYNYEILLPELTRPEDPSDLEITYRGEKSNQFPFMDIPFELGAQTFSVVAPKHNSKHDPTLLPASLDKRLRFRPCDSRFQPSAQDFIAANLLYYSYCDALHLSPTDRVAFDPNLYIDCIAENEFAQLSSKTQATIMANASRSDPDWRHSVVRIFTKTQHKINNDSLFTGWKACQTLALMHDFIILTFGPIKKYQRAILQRQGTNPNIFVYGGHSPFELSDFVRSTFPKDTPPHPL